MSKERTNNLVGVSDLAHFAANPERFLEAQKNGGVYNKQAVKAGNKGHDNVSAHSADSRWFWLITAAAIAAALFAVESLA